MEESDHRIRLNDMELEYLVHVLKEYGVTTLPEDRPDGMSWEEWRFGNDLYDRFSAVLHRKTYAKRGYMTQI